MDKLLIFSFIGTIIISALSWILTPIMLELSDFSIIISESKWYAGGILNLLTTIFSFIMIIRLLSHYRDRKKTVTEILILYFFATGIATSIQGIFAFFNFADRGVRQINEAISYYFIVLSTFCMLYFIFEVFSKEAAAQENRKPLTIFSILLILFDLYIFRLTLRWAWDGEIYFFGLLFLGISTYVYLRLIRSALFLRSRMEQDLLKQSFSLMALSGMIILTGYLVTAIYNVAIGESVIFHILTSASFMVGGILLYFGFTLPIRKLEK